MDMMKMKKLLAYALLLAVWGGVMQSCAEDDDDNMTKYQPTALVTVIPVGETSFVLQLDDSTTLQPVNMTASPYGDKEVRALVNYVETRNTPAKNFQKIHINWIDSIRTKLPVADMGEENDACYGKDPIELVKDWVTIAEDGYLTLRIRTKWGANNTPHFINLLTGGNPENPFELELRHDAQGDKNGVMGDALIAFNLNQLPRNGAQKVELTLKWHSFSGEKSTTFKLGFRTNL